MQRASLYILCQMELLISYPLTTFACLSFLPDTYI